MTICFFSAQYLPTVGGVERYTYNLAKRVAARGDRAVVVTSALDGLPARETGADGIEVLRLPCFALMNGRFPFVKRNGEFKQLADVLWKELKPDFVVANNLFYSLSLYAVTQAKKRNIPAILINHGTQYLMTGNPVVAAMGMVYEWLTAWLVQMQCRKFYAVSGAGAAWLKKAFNITADGIIYNAVDPDEVAELAKKGEPDWRKRLDLAPDTPLIGFAGRVIPEKGADQLCAAMTNIRKAVPDAVAVLAGDGNLLDSLRAAKPDGVYLVGQVAYADALSLIAQSDVFCLPSRSEGFASTVLEAAALGTPVLTTPTGGSVELIVDAEHGTLLPDMSARSIETACIDALSDAAWRARAASNANALLRGRFTWERSADKLCSVIQSMTAPAEK